jgi:hypothetical protein
MKTPLLLCLLLAASPSRGLTAPLGSSTTTYQGRLTEAAAPANGEYDLRFTLYDAVNGGSQTGSILTNENVWVTNGVFTAALDFGTNIFTGQAVWLDIAVRPGSAKETLRCSPRVNPLAPCPTRSMRSRRRGHQHAADHGLRPAENPRHAGHQRRYLRR